MTIHKAKASAYNEVTTAAVYDYMRQYLAEISRMIEPEEDGGTGNAYKAKLQQMENELLEVGKMNNSKLNELFDICFNCENEESTWCDDCPIKKKIDLLQYNERGKNHDL